MVAGIFQVENEPEIFIRNYPEREIKIVPESCAITPEIFIRNYPEREIRIISESCATTPELSVEQLRLQDLLDVDNPPEGIEKGFILAFDETWKAENTIDGLDTTLLLKGSNETGVIPSDLENRELFINYADSKIYFKNSNDEIKAIGELASIDAQVLLDTLKTCDGESSGLNADLLDGNHASYFAKTSQLNIPNGQIVFGNSGTLSSNTNLFWNKDNEHLGIGLRVPSSKVHILSQNDHLRLDYDLVHYTNLLVDSNGSLTINGTGNQLKVGYQLASQVTGVAPFTVASSLIVTGLNCDMVDGAHASSSSTPSTVVLRDTSGVIHHSGVHLSEGTRIDQVKTITKSLTLQNTWQDTGICATDLETGTYVIQVYANDNNSGGQNINERYSGIMSWYSQTTNSEIELPTDEIQLHRAGASSDGTLYLRTFRSLANNASGLRLQIYSNTNNPSASNYVFSFRRLI